MCAPLLLCAVLLTAAAALGAIDCVRGSRKVDSSAVQSGPKNRTDTCFALCHFEPCRADGQLAATGVRVRAGGSEDDGPSECAFAAIGEAHKKKPQLK